MPSDFVKRHELAGKFRFLNERGELIGPYALHSIPADALMVGQVSDISKKLGVITSGTAYFGDINGACVALGDDVDGLEVRVADGRPFVVFDNRGTGYARIGLPQVPGFDVINGVPEAHGGMIVDGTLGIYALRRGGDDGIGELTNTLLTHDYIFTGIGTPVYDNATDTWQGNATGFLATMGRVGGFRNGAWPWEVDNATGYLMSRSTLDPIRIYSRFGSSEIEIASRTDLPGYAYWGHPTLGSNSRIKFTSHFLLNPEDDSVNWIWRKYHLNMALNGFNLLLSTNVDCSEEGVPNFETNAPSIYLADSTGFVTGTYAANAITMVCDRQFYGIMAVNKYTGMRIYWDGYYMDTDPVTGLPIPISTPIFFNAGGGDDGMTAKIYSDRLALAGGFVEIAPDQYGSWAGRPDTTRLTGCAIRANETTGVPEWYNKIDDHWYSFNMTVE